MTVSVRCPAKVNLHLEVLGRRGDGYHELRTIFASVGVWDELSFAPAPAGELTLAVEPDGAVPADGTNLILKAARALGEVWPQAAGAHIRLRKRIPVAGGMGGGSADAAAALVGLTALWRIPAQPGELRRVGAELGADVPFFLVGGAAWGVGRGSEVYPLPDLPPWWVVLVPGRESVPTAEVYRALPPRALDGQPVSEVYEWVVSGGELPIRACRNDLQPTVLERWPAVAGRLERVERTSPRLAMVSGSGGTVFGLFGDEASALDAALALADLGPVVAPVLQRDVARLQPSVGED